MGTKGLGDASADPEPSRREFLKAGGLGSIGWACAAPSRLIAAPAGPRPDRALILLLLVGGPSQLETWDPKPDAPAEIRGPFRTIESAVPGVRINEHLPRLARRLDRLTILRALHHDAAPIHEIGQQLIQTGRLCRLGDERPHVGSVVARLRGASGDLPSSVILPGPIGNTGLSLSHGQSAGRLGGEFDPFFLNDDPASPGYDPRAVAARAATAARGAFDLEAEPEALRTAYGRNTFGQCCLLARRLVEAGVRCVTINMAATVFHHRGWDCHGSHPFSTLDDYPRSVLPSFDGAFATLIDDLECRGLLDTTLVVATGEFGRSPRLNAQGGRDHWPAVWSAALAGGGTRGGQVIGASDAHAAFPADRPVFPAELVATIYRGLGIDPSRTLTLDGTEEMTLVEEARPIAEVFG